ncbi:hypothetical protein EU545_03210 [Candidatus Thorarchaeota archaeon]|nr:MAG: hypothetical protein EU545_03210 [Candidatus Thorarchaeota archaeon]
MPEADADIQATILQADGKTDETHGYGHPIRLRLEEYGFRVEIVDLPSVASRLEGLPKKPVIISGGMTEVTADVKWIMESKEFLRTVIETNRDSPPNQRRGIFGICFGAQLIAEALNPGSVLFLDDPEIGVSQIALQETDHPLFEGFEPEFPAYSFHYNQIRPNGVSVISDHRYKGHHFVQAFEVADGAAYGVQFHPEFRKDEMKALLLTYTSLMKDLGVDVAPIAENLPTLRGTERILLNFMKMHTKWSRHH